MKRLVALMMVVALSAFSIGCGDKKTTTTTKDKNGEKTTTTTTTENDK